MIRAIVALLALVVCLPASAEELAYRWQPGEPLRYRIQFGLNTAEPMWFVSGENLEARARQVAFGLELTCVPEPPKRRRQDWTCAIDKAELVGGGLAGDEEKIARIFDEYVRLYEQATIQVEWTPTGRVRTIDLEGVPKTTEREQARHEYMRMLVAKAFSGLELELPGEEAESWKQRGSPLAFRLPTRFGTSGGVRLKHRVANREGSTVAITSEGEATVTTGAALENGSDDAVSMKLAGAALLDVEAGRLLRNDVRVQGVYTASSDRLVSTFLDQRVLAEWLPPEEGSR